MAQKYESEIVKIEREIETLKAQRDGLSTDLNELEGQLAQFEPTAIASAPSGSVGELLRRRRSLLQQLESGRRLSDEERLILDERIEQLEAQLATARTNLRIAQIDAQLAEIRPQFDECRSRLDAARSAFIAAITELAAIGSRGNDLLYERDLLSDGKTAKLCLMPDYVQIPGVAGASGTVYAGVFENVLFASGDAAIVPLFWAGE